VNMSIKEARDIHGLFVMLFCLVIPLTLLPIVVDYYQRKNTTDINDNRAVGSYIIGAWTFLLSFVYIGVLPSVNMRLRMLTPSDVESKLALIPQEGDVPDSTEFKMLQCLAHYQPLITFAYWNALQTPCYVMILAVSTRYGIDLNLQYILFGAVAIGLLDIVHARLNIIMRVMQRLDENVFMLADHILVEVLFLCMHLIIALVVYVKLADMNVSTWSIFRVAALLMVQPIQDIVLVVWELIELNTSKTTDSRSYKYQYTTSLVWHEVVSILVFITTFINVNAS